MGYAINVCIGLAILTTTSSALAINSKLDGLNIGFDEIKCGRDPESSEPAVQTTNMALPGKVTESFGIPVIPHEYNSIGPLDPPLRPFDTMSVVFNYYRSEVPGGYKFELVSYDRFIFLGSKDDRATSVQNYGKVEQDLIERLGAPMNKAPKIADDGKYVSTWWKYEQKGAGDILYVGLTGEEYGVFENKRFASIFAVCEMQWIGFRFSELLMEQMKQKGNLFK